MLTLDVKRDSSGKQFNEDQHPEKYVSINLAEILATTRKVDIKSRIIKIETKEITTIRT